MYFHYRRFVLGAVGVRTKETFARWINNLIKVNERADATMICRRVEIKVSKSSRRDAKNSLVRCPLSAGYWAAIIILGLLMSLGIRKFIRRSLSCGTILPDPFTKVSCNRYCAPCRRYSPPVFPLFTSVTSRFDGECWSRSNATMILASNIGFNSSIKNYNRNFCTRHEPIASFSILQTAGQQF